MTEHTFASDRSSGYPESGSRFITAVEPPTLEQPRPEVARDAAEVARMGRPYGIHSGDRRREFFRLLAAGETEGEACRKSGMSRHALVTNLERDEFFTAYVALRQGRCQSFALTVAGEQDANLAA